MRIRRMVPLAPVFLLFVTAVPAVYAQYEDVEPATRWNDPADLVDAPTAAVLAHGSYDMAVHLFSDGGVLSGARLGLRDRFQLGISYGGTDVLGRGSPIWNPRVEFECKAAILPETYSGPALAVGFDSQGHGIYDEQQNRYQFKSKGFYAVASKHYLFFGELGIHGGMNYSLEDDDGDDDVDLFLGLEKSLHESVDFFIEYDAAWNDNLANDRYGNRGGYWNAAAVVRLGGAVHMNLEFRNLFENREESGIGERGDWSREVQITYVDYF